MDTSQKFHNLRHKLLRCSDPANTELKASGVERVKEQINFHPDRVNFRVTIRGGRILI